MWVVLWKGVWQKEAKGGTDEARSLPSDGLSPGDRVHTPSMPQLLPPPPGSHMMVRLGSVQSPPSECLWGKKGRGMWMYLSSRKGRYSCLKMDEVKILVRFTFVPQSFHQSHFIGQLKVEKELWSAMYFLFCCCPCVNNDIPGQGLMLLCPLSGDIVHLVGHYPLLKQLTASLVNWANEKYFILSTKRQTLLCHFHTRRRETSCLTAEINRPCVLITITFFYSSSEARLNRKVNQLCADGGLR